MWLCLALEAMHHQGCVLPLRPCTTRLHQAGSDAAVLTWTMIAMGIGLHGYGYHGYDGDGDWFTGCAEVRRGEVV